jgi:hypothetical protein
MRPAPHLNLLQVDLISIRTNEDVSWSMRRAGRVTFLTDAIS